MTTDLEQAGKAFLTARLAAGGLLAAHPYDVRAATQRGDPPGDRFVIIAKASQTDRTLVDLQDFTLTCGVVAYPAIKSHDETALALVQRAIVAAWETSGADEAWDSAVQALIPGWHDGGLYPGHWQEANEANQWMPGYVIDIGIARDGV